MRKKRDKAVYDQRLKTEKVYRKVPRIKAIDKEIWQIGLLMSKAVIENPNNYEEGLQQIKNKLKS